MRKFHINQLPNDRIFVLLNKKFHKELFQKIKNTFSFQRLNKLMEGELTRSTYKKWFYRLKGNKFNKNPRFIPLWFFTKISKILPFFDINKIERNILAYKGPSASTIILKPRFPLNENERILRIIAHLIGDGHADGAFGTNLPKGKSSSHYANTNLDVIKSFRRDLKVFGNFKTNIKIDKVREHRIYKIGVPNLMGYILTHIYNINFNCLDSRIPKSLYKLGKRNLTNFIKAFADDEGHVFDSSIEFYSANLDLIKGLIRLIRLKFPEIKISSLKINDKVRNNIKYSFSILASGLEFYAKSIGFDHKQKMKDLLFNIKRVKLDNRHNQRLDTKNRLLKELSRNNLTAKQLSRRYFLRHSYILKQLNELKKEGKVEIINKDKFSNIWSLKISSYSNDPNDHLS